MSYYLAKKTFRPVINYRHFSLYMANAANYLLSKQNETTKQVVCFLAWSVFLNIQTFFGSISRVWTLEKTNKRSNLLTSTP